VLRPLASQRHRLRPPDQPIVPAEYKKEGDNRAKVFGFAAFHIDRKPDRRASLRAAIGEFGDVTTALSW
jgi:hypothetical protein